MVIPFHRANISAAEEEAVLAALRQADLEGSGPHSRQLEAAMAEATGHRHALFTTSCTSAFELGLMALERPAGQTIALPSFSYPSMAATALKLGFKVLLTDIDPDTMMIGPDQIKQAAEQGADLVMVVHYGGQALDMEVLKAAAPELTFIEDSAQCIGITMKGQPLGTHSAFSCLSLHKTKNVVGGEGGLCLTNDDDLFRSMEIVVEKGTDKAAFLRGEVPRYQWIRMGGSFIQSGLLAALALCQLKRSADFCRRRAMIAKRYDQLLSAFVERGLRLPPRIEECQSNHHLYVVRVPSDKRNPILKALRQDGLMATTHYEPLHLSPMAKERLGLNLSLPGTEQLVSELIRLPIYSDLKDSEIDQACSILEKVLGAHL